MTMPSELTTGQPNADTEFNPESEKAATEMQKNVVSWAKHHYERCKQARSSTEKQWYLNLAFYFGKQNVVPRQSQSIITSTTSNLYTPPAPYYRVRPVINRIRPTVRTELAKLTSQKPNAYVIPASSDDHDLFAAQAGEQIWDSTYRKHHFHKTLRKALFWTLTCGTGYIKNYWDPDKQDPESDVPGDFCFQAETPFHIFVPDLREEDLEAQPYVIHAQLKSLDWIKMYYPTLDLGTSARAPEEILEDSWLNLIGSTSVNTYKLLVLECWIKPGRVAMFPDGAVFTIVGDQLAQGGMGWPYQHGKYPFAKIDHIPGGKFYSDSSIVDLIPLQREYNRTRGQIIEAKNRMAKPQLAAEKGSLDPSKITSEPGQVILYTPGFQPPQPIPLQSLPSYVLQELDRILLDWSDIAGIHEVSQGQAPPGVTAATAISYLQEQDETKLSHTVSSIEDAVEKVAQMTLSYVGQFWDAERIVKVAGADGAFDAMSFKGSDLRGNSDIMVEAGSALPTSRAAKQAMIMDFMKMGFITPEEGLGVLELGGINKIYDKLQIDKKQAQRENLKMSKANQQLIDMHNQQQLENLIDEQGYGIDPNGLPVDDDGVPVPPELLVPVNTYDNHAIHIMVHNDFRKSQSFENVPPEVKALFDQHVNGHLASLQMMQQGQMAAQMPPQDPAMMEQGVPPITEDNTEGGPQQDGAA